MPNNSFWENDARPVATAPAKSNFWEADAQPIDAGPDVTQEMPDISGLTTSRAMVKNFGNDINSSIQYLQQKHPDADFMAIGDQILAKKKSDQKWGVLDPNTSLFSLGTLKDLPQDITDIVTDVASGLGTSAASVLGGMAGLATGPGALLSGAAAGAAAGGGIESMRQWLGKQAGVNKEVNTGDVALSAGLGAVAPLLMGTGATAAQVAKGALKSGLTADVVREANRGIIGKAMPYASEVLSGVPADTFKALRKYLPEIQEARKLGEGGARLQFAEQAQGDLKDALKAHKDTLTNRFTEALDAAPDFSVNIGKVLEPVRERIAKLGEERARAGTAGIEKELSTLAKFEKDILPTAKIVDDFGVEKSIPVDNLNARDATSYLGRLRAKLESIGALDGQTGKISFERVKEGNKLAAETMQATYNAVSKQLDTAVSTLDAPLRKDYAQFKNIERLWEPNLKTAEKTDKFLRNLNRREKTILNEVVQNQGAAIGKDMKPLMDKMSAFGMYLDPAMAPLSGMGTTSTSRTWGLTPLLGSIGYKIAEAIKPGMGFIGAGITGLATNLVTSPAAQYRAMAIKEGLRKATEKGLGKVGATAVGNTIPWTMMSQYGKGGE